MIKFYITIKKKKEKPLDDPKHPCPCPHLSAYLLDFSLCFLCEVYLKNHYCCLLITSQMQVPHAPSCPLASLHRKKLPFRPWLVFHGLTYGVVSPLSMWTQILALPWSPPYYHGGLFCLLLSPPPLPCLILFTYYFLDYWRPQAFGLCCLLYKDPVVNLLYIDNFNYQRCSCWLPSLYSSDLFSEIQSHISWDLLDMVTLLYFWCF